MSKGIQFVNRFPIRLLFMGIFCVLLAATLANFMDVPISARRAFHHSLRDEFAQVGDHSGWSVTYAPIAETPEVQKKVDEELNYTDAVYAIYTQNDFRISIYVAYWAPGRMSERWIAGHTPDVCWVGNGWHIAAGETVVLPETIMPARLSRWEYRTFDRDNTIEYVVFNHFVDGAIASYKDTKRILWMPQDIIQHGLRLRNEQFFVRISSNRPLQEFINTTVCQRTLHRLLLLVNKTKSNEGVMPPF